MAKIIPFRQPVFSGHGTGKAAHEIFGKRNNPPPWPKEPVVISVMPDEPFPIGHRDLRPLLQRDGLVLLSWALWEDWEGDGSLLQRYIVTWTASGGGAARRYATGPVQGNKLAEAVPERRADAFFYRGKFGSYFEASRSDRSDRFTADYLYLAAPFDLDSRTLPGYIRVLKSLGSTVDFDHVFTLGTSRKSEAREYLEKFNLSKQEKSL